MVDNPSHQLFAKTFFGLEDVLEKELLQLGAREIKKGKRGVQFVGDTGFIYKANLALRTALRILMQIDRFKIRGQKDLYNKMVKFPWETIFDSDKTFMVDATIFNCCFSNSLFAAQTLKDAIVDRFRQKQQKRPNVKTGGGAHIRINLHISEDVVTISLDSSGDSLHQRGYRTEVGKAPLNEVMAAGILQLSNWYPGKPLLDPMCGSGTLLIEAALMASNMAPGIYRKEFSFMHWKDYDAELHEKIEESLLKRAVNYDGEIVGWDSDPIMVLKAKENIKKALFEDLIKVEVKNFFRGTPEWEKGILISNPPYDKKLEIKEKDWYKRLGNTLKKNYTGWEAWFITANLPALKDVGLRPSKKIPLLNAKLESRLVKYEMFKGFRKDKLANESR